VLCYFFGTEMAKCRETIFMRTKASTKIFLVDDSLFFRNLYKKHFINLGFTSIQCFEDAESLMENISESPDIIFLDYHLEDGIGIDLLERIKLIDPSIYVVIISGQSDMEVTVKLLNSGAFDYIIKDDFEQQRIAEVMGKWLSACQFNKDIDVAGGVENSQKFIQMLVNAQDRVRKEISGELHDNVNQLLGATKLYMETACRDEKNRLPLIMESKGIIETAISEIRKLSHSLQAFDESDYDLEEKVMKIVGDLKSQQQYQVTADIRLQQINEYLFKDIQLNVLRIIQELVNNTVKYSMANQIHIGIKVQRNNLLLKIADDGIGFNIETVKKGLGLSNIIQRLSKIKGTYSLDSAPGEGCIWEIWVPVQCVS
jgi:signal transduction histidine kinase